MSKRPNLFIIGAMKSGTSSLCSYIAPHPSIYICEPREPSYFVHPEQLQWDAIKQLNLWGNEQKYLNLFSGVTTEKIIIDASTLYTKAPHITSIPERILAFNPDARFIYIMRDPVERTISHYWHEVQRGTEYESLYKAIKNNPLYCDVSYYAQQLRLYFKLFSRDRFLTLSFENLVQNPQLTCKTVFNWLEINPNFNAKNIGEKVHATPPIVQQKKSVYRAKSNPVISHLFKATPQFFQEVIKKVVTKKVSRKDNLIEIEETKKYLRKKYKEQVVELESILDESFEYWKI